MEPLPLTFRRIVAVIFFLLFAVILVVVSIYASGYRLDDGLTLERTGGVHVSVPITGATVYLDGEEVGTSSFLEKSFFIDNLGFGTYEVSVEAPGYMPWKKNIIVERALVTETSAFMISEEYMFVPVIVGTSTTATTTREVSHSYLEDVLALFEPAATSTELVGPIELIVRDGNVFVHWNRSLERAPSAFCITPRGCVVEVSVEISERHVSHAEFFMNGVLYQTPTGLYLAEIDVKHPQIVVPIYGSPDVLFRLYDDELFILDGEELFVLEF